MERAEDLAEVILILGAHEVRLARVDIEHRCTLALIEELAKLQLVARAHGWSIVLEGAAATLVEFIDLAGLSAAIPTRPRT